MDAEAGAQSCHQPQREARFHGYVDTRNTAQHSVDMRSLLAVEALFSGEPW
jgi:hypothetical protein